MERPGLDPARNSSVILTAATDVLGFIAFRGFAVLFLFLIFRWLFDWITDIIQPVTNLVIARDQFQEIVAERN